MPDDTLVTLLTTGGSVVAGGGVSAVVVRALFSTFGDRLKGMEEAVKQLVQKSDERHERLIERLAAVEGKADAAHRRLDEMKGRRR